MSEPSQEQTEGLAGMTIAALLLAAAQAPLGSTMIAVALPAISHGVGSDIALVTNLLVTSYLIVNIVGQSPGGKLGDVLGHAHTVHLGMGLQALGALVGLLASRLDLLVISRCTLALGGALVVPSTMALLRVHVPFERRGRVFGLVGSTMSLSAGIGPPLGGELVGRFGWRAIFFVSLPFLGVAAAMIRLSPVPRARTIERTSLRDFARGFDWTGTLLIAGALAALVIASKLDGLNRALALGAAAAVATIFVFWELRCKSPILDPRLFQRGAFAAGSAIISLSNFAMYGLLFLLPQFFQQMRGATAKEVGRILFLMMLAMFLTSPVGGRLNDRFGSRATALSGLLPFLVGVVWLRRVGALHAPFDAVPALVLLGIGLGLSGAPAQAAAMASVPSTRSGMAAGATSTLRYIGSVLSILMLSAFLGGRHGATDIGAYEAAATAFAIAAGLAAAAGFALPGRAPQPGRGVLS